MTTQIWQRQERAEGRMVRRIQAGRDAQLERERRLALRESREVLAAGLARRRRARDARARAAAA